MENVIRSFFTLNFTTRLIILSIIGIFGKFKKGIYKIADQMNYTNTLFERLVSVTNLIFLANYVNITVKQSFIIKLSYTACLIVTIFIRNLLLSNDCFVAHGQIPVLVILCYLLKPAFEWNLFLVLYSLRSKSQIN